MSEPVVPLHSRSARQSPCTVQVFAHSVPAPPTIEAQIEPSGQSEVEPAVVHGLVQ
jgi:hypothetical protein